MKKIITSLIIAICTLWAGISSSFGQALLYGVTIEGGANNQGVLYEWNTAIDTYTKKFDFGGANGTWPSSSLHLYEGKFIGMTYEGGVYDNGVIYEYDPVNEMYTKKFDFDGTNGSQPLYDLVFHEGKFYGTTTWGGAFNGGVIFEWDPLMNTYTKKHDFMDLGGWTSTPNGKLVMHSGKFYGTCQYGGTNGANGLGYIFEWDPVTNVFTNVFDFEEPGGVVPNSLTLYQSKLYGTTQGGGNNSVGVIFSWDPANDIYTTAHNFDWNLEGGTPIHDLVLIQDKFYGVAANAGPLDGGVLYEFEPVSTIYTVKHAFDLNNTSNGYYPIGGVTSSGGKLYGTTYYGGPSGFDLGVFYELDPLTNVYSSKFEFTGPANGAYSGYSSLLEYFPPTSDNDGDGYTFTDGDCDDNDPEINPGVSELCNGIDDDCDGDIDEGFVYSVAGTSITSSEGENFCLGTTTYLSVTGGILGTGADWVWYEGGCGNSDPLGTGETLQVTPSEGTHTYFVRAEGICNTSDCFSLSVTVDKAPVFQLCPTDINTGNDAGSCFSTVYYNVTATGSPAPAFSYAFAGATTGNGTGTGSGSIFNAGTTTVTVTAENYCGTETCTFDVTVNDTEGPVISDCPSGITLEAEEGQWGASVSWAPPTATDNCSVTTLASSHEPGHFFNVGSTPVTYTATDEAGNSSACQFLVTVTPPDFLGSVNLSTISSEITFSDNNPAPGSQLSVNALIRNNSNIDAGSFSVQFADLYTNTTYPLIPLPGLNAGQSLLVSQLILAPNVPSFVPIQVAVDVTNSFDESSEFDNAAVRPFVCGDVAVPGNMDLLASAVPAAVPAGSTIQICGSASYDTDPPLADPSVAGAEVIISITETGQQFTGYTDEDGNFCIAYATPNTPGEFHFTVEITDNILSGDAEGSFTLSEPVNPCPTDLSLSIDLPGIGSSYTGSAIIAAGTSFSGTVLVQNNCTAITEQTTLFIAPPAGTVNAYEVLVPSLGPGETYPVALPVLTMNSTGDFFLSATVDFKNIVEEDQENNNTEYLTLIVKPAMPDIVVAKAELASNLACFENNTVFFSILNSGLVATGPFTSVLNFYVNGILQSSQSQIIQDLGPGGQMTRSFVFTLTAPGDLIGFELFNDPANEVAELSELNNDFDFETGFRLCLPDLEVSDCYYTDVKPADAMQSGMASITATIVNQGESTLTVPFEVAFLVGSTTITETVDGPLAPQQAVQVTIESPLPVDECVSLSITADPDDIVLEKQNNNNFFSGSLCYDFELTNFQCGGSMVLPQTQYFCDPGQFRIGYLNHGLYEASELEVRFEISGPGLTGWVLLGTESVYAGNSCGCPVVLDFPGSFYFPQTGTYQIRMTADPEDLYPESNEGNNELTVSFDVVETSDYEVLAPYIFPSKINPEINEAVSFSVSYTNNGCDGVTPIELYTLVDEDPLASVTVVPLLSGDWNTAAIPQTWSSSVPGVHVFRAIIDYSEAIAEGNEMNNEATKAIYVGGAPDYHVLFVSASDENPEAGQLVTLTADVLNEGQSAGSGLLRFLRADAHGVETLISEESISLAPGITQSYSTSWPVTYPGAKIIARVVNVLPAEFDLSDNEKETQLNDLQVSIAGTNALCNGEYSGEIVVTITGGAAPFLIEWSDPALFGQVVNVPAGEYLVTVLDNIGLSATASITISEPEALVLTETHIDASCDNLSDGSVNLGVSGGTSPYTIIWNNGELTEDLTGLEAGTYSVLVTDANNCSATLSITLAALYEAIAWYQDTDNDGFGNANDSVISCTQPDGYVSNPDDCDDNNSAINPAETEICGNNFDDNCNGQVDEGCDTECDISVNAGADVTTYFGIVSMQQVVRTAQVTGGTPPFTYSWTMDRPLLCNQQNSTGDESFTGGICTDNICPSSGLPGENPNCSGSATIYATMLDTAVVCVTVTDANGCSASDCFTVMASDVRCFAGNSGNHKIKMCHKTNSQNNPWVEICVDTNSINAHLAHGDYIGSCDGAKSDKIESEAEDDFSFDFNLFPNPAEDRITLSFHCHNESSYWIEIMDMTGRVVAKYKENSFHGDISHQIDLTGLERGIYTVTLILGGQRMVKKLIRN